MAKQAEHQRQLDLMTEAQRQQAVRLAIQAQHRQSSRWRRRRAGCRHESPRLRLQTQQAGVPQNFVPGVGIVPYGGGIASPYPYVYPTPSP